MSRWAVIAAIVAIGFAVAIFYQRQAESKRQAEALKADPYAGASLPSQPFRSVPPARAPSPAAGR
ncbi:MAG: hypothetical protein DI623_11435 [Sphingomonas sanxanigenens]|uniref:Uncharacterized protein n=1 Tax=Sphingomonas sanxanigenens TaxID=397260 RepID=A0A2W5C4G7_9SPHN|nr:MAG: hypothetical protein DI623_11435 [Sphingomonas sanxanigenens]